MLSRSAAADHGRWQAWPGQTAYTHAAKRRAGHTSERYPILPWCRHPDKNNNSPESTHRFQSINAAYVRLTKVRVVLRRC